MKNIDTNNTNNNNDDVSLSEVNQPSESIVPGVAMASNPTATADADDPLTLFNWQIKHRATTSFANGPYEARLILGSDVLIRSGDAIEELLTLIRQEAANVVAKLES